MTHLNQGRTSVTGRPTGRLTRLAAVMSIALSAAACTTAPVYLNSGKILPATLPFSEAVRVGDTLYLSGQIGNLPGGVKLAEGGISAESKQALENIKTSLEAHGYALSDLVKCTAMLADMKEWGAFNEVYQTYFAPGRYPARSAFGTSGLAFNARVEIECTAVKSK